MTEQYGGRFSELYDLFYADKPYAAEAEFIHQCIQRLKSGSATRVLELACGTGRHAQELQKRGYQVLGTDISESMLARAQHLASPGLEFRRQDMRKLDVPERPFDTVVALFDSIGYALTNAALEETLRCIRAHLRVGGLFLFEFWHAGAMLRDFEPVRVRRWESPYGGTVTRISETTLDVAKQSATVRFEVFAPTNDGHVERFSETHVNRYFLVQEMAALLQHGGLVPVEWYADWSYTKPVDQNAWHVIGVGRAE